MSPNWPVWQISPSLCTETVAVDVHLESDRRER